MTCNNGDHLPDEGSVIKTKGKCYVTVSVFDAGNKRDASIEQQVCLLFFPFVWMVEVDGWGLCRLRFWGRLVRCLFVRRRSVDLGWGGCY